MKILFTLNATDRHGVAYSIGNGQINSLKMEEVCKTLDCMHDKQAALINKPRIHCSPPDPDRVRKIAGIPGHIGNYPDKKRSLQTRNISSGWMCGTHTQP